MIDDVPMLADEQAGTAIELRVAATFTVCLWLCGEEWPS